MLYLPKAYYQLLFLITCLSVITINSLFSHSVVAENVTNTHSQFQITQQEQSDLNNGKAIIRGEKGNYLGFIAANGDLDTTWKVLTDYNNFKNFFPNVAASKLLKSHGNRKVFQQINIVGIWFFTKKYTLEIATEETYPQNIAFKIVKGELDTLEGSWQLKSLAAKQTLIIYRVKVAPRNGANLNQFYGIYEKSLLKTLTALDREITKRSQSK
jgi:ribosome-associated toxin RatA of RatAB toxin-antitoxin module